MNIALGIFIAWAVGAILTLLFFWSVGHAFSDHAPFSPGDAMTAALWFIVLPVTAAMVVSEIVRAHLRRG